MMKPIRCCDDVKDTKNESHSQRIVQLPGVVECCCDDVKDTKNESHSQQRFLVGIGSISCCDDVKDTKNESHSQPLRSFSCFEPPHQIGQELFLIGSSGKHIDGIM